ncbi:IGR protein motif [Dillenia turbinata]|uniref:IGR protein motif n=1 Tax=Dillenia turbinata TaxID=194707 RepID=A0AAN8UA47_9MAGN
MTSMFNNGMEANDIFKQNGFCYTARAVKVGIPEFLTGVGKGVETHIEKLENEIGDFQQLLVTRTLKLKKLGIPCKHRKLILKYTHKYRLGLWRPQAEPGKSQA